MILENGIVKVDSGSGNALGFTSDKFTADSYLWVNGDEILISLITTKDQGRGYFSELRRNIEQAGYKMIVPTPLGSMAQILARWDFKPYQHVDPIFGMVELWKLADSRP